MLNLSPGQKVWIPTLYSKVINVRNDTFGNPIFQKDFENTNLEAHFLLLAFFDKVNFLTTLLLKLGQIFDEVAKLGKPTQDAYDPGKWLIL